MRTWNVLGSLVIGMIVTLPMMGFAQDSTLTGTATDSTGGVLPGVTVTATNIESGNTFVAASDERGNFRLRCGLEITESRQSWLDSRRSPGTSRYS